MRLLALSSLLVVGGCIPAVTYLRPEIGLASVQRPTATAQRYGPQSITPVPDSANRYRFEDSLIVATFVAGSDRIVFDLSNKTEFPIQLGWTEAAFVDIASQSQPVMHTGVKYTDCSAPKAPSVIVAKGRITDVAIPCNYVRFGYSNWVIDSYLRLPTLVPVDSAAIAAKLATEKLKGKTVQLLLPIKTRDVVNDYTFTFQVNAVVGGTTIRP